MMVDYISKVSVASSPFWVVQLYIMSPKVGQCHLPPASEVGVASSLLQGHVHAMSKSWWHSSWNFKVLLASPCIFKVLMRAPLQCQSLGGILLGISRFRWHHRNLNEKSLHLQSLDRDSLHFQHLVGISKILMSGYSAIRPWCLSDVAFENCFIWTLAQLRRIKCWHSFNGNVECWHGFMNIGMTSMQMKFRRGFMNVITASANEVLT